MVFVIIYQTPVITRRGNGENNISESIADYNQVSSVIYKVSKYTSVSGSYDDYCNSCFMFLVSYSENNTAGRYELSAETIIMILY